VGDPARTFLVTGTTGFLGKLVLEALLRRPEALGRERVYLAIRKQGSVSAARRFRRLAERAACLAGLPSGWSEQIAVVEGDLSAPGCGFDTATRRLLQREVSHVLHVAASVEFDRPLAEATASNVTASLNVLELARGCGRLVSATAVSTAYVSPHPGEGVSIEEELPPLPAPAPELYAAIRSGRVAEGELLERSGHPNTYTLTKALSEQLLVQQRGGIPLSIVRPSIITATWRRPFPGWIDSSAAFAGFVAMIGAGHLRAVVGDPRARLNLVPADWVAEQTLAAALAPPRDGLRIRHAVAAARHTPSLEECRRAIVGFFRSHPARRRASLSYLGPPGMRFRLADGLRNRAPVRLAMLRSPRQRQRTRRLLDGIDHLNRQFPYFTSRSFAFRASQPFDPPDFDRNEFLGLVCSGVARHLMRLPVPKERGPAPAAGRSAP
jgi:fatty acyl-CoA reductase